MGKKVNSRERHLLVDTLGLILSVVVHPANLADRDGAKLVFGGVADAFPRLKHVWADSGYQRSLRGWLGEHFRIRLEIVKKPSRWVWLPEGVEPPPYPKGFQVLKRRWVVEPGALWADLGGWDDIGC